MRRLIPALLAAVVLSPLAPLFAVGAYNQIPAALGSGAVGQLAGYLGATTPGLGSVPVYYSSTNSSLTFAGQFIAATLTPTAPLGTAYGGTGTATLGAGLSTAFNTSTNAASGLLQLNAAGVVPLPGFTIATLPACSSNRGAVAYVTNAVASPTYLGAVGTTGSSSAKVFCNGSAWVYD